MDRFLTVPTDKIIQIMGLFSIFTLIIIPLSSISNYRLTINGYVYNNIKDSRTIILTFSITLSFVLSLFNLAFNLIYLSKLTKDLNCSVLFFPDHYIFQDLMTKKIIW